MDLRPVINDMDQRIEFAVVKVGNAGIQMGPHLGAPRCERRSESRWVCLEWRSQGKRSAKARSRLIDAGAQETEAESSG